MENVLLRLCRATHRINRRQVAASLGMTPKEYTELETGVLAMKPEQAQILSDLYNINPRYIIESARQIELLHSRMAVIKILNNENQRMEKLLEGGYELLHQSKQKAS